MTHFDVCAWIMFIHVQTCFLSDFITSGNREIYKEDNKSTLERLGLQGTFKFRALWSVRDGKGLKYNTRTSENHISNSVYMNLYFRLPKLK